MAGAQTDDATAGPIVFGLLHNAYIKGFIDGKIYTGNAKNACVPGFNCYSCPGAVGACPLGALQNALAFAGHRAGWYVLGILLLFGVILGRTICGWLCTMGVNQELLHGIPTPKIRKSGEPGVSPAWSRLRSLRRGRKTAAETPGVDRYDSDAPVGHEVGQRLADFTLQCYDGAGFHLADTRGKIAFINLWATYCTPCIQEQPYFSELHTAYAGDAAMIAMHPRPVTIVFLSGKDFAMPFATDVDDAVNGIVGGTGTLPQTVVLNRRGEVVYNQIGFITPEILAALYDEADE